MDELKPGGQEPNQQEKVKLTDEQKLYIRVEMAKCGNPQDARIRRRELARETGASIKQISAVSAYKVGAEGLNLRPQFPKPFGISEAPAPAEVTPKIEEIYDNPTKEAWRNEIRKVIESDFTKEDLRNARVVCLPGQALQEVTGIYAKLGIQPQNIVCIERDKDSAKTMRANADAMKLPVSIFEGSIEMFLQSPHEPVTIASFDFLGPLHRSFLENLRHLRTADRFMIITNFLQRRERKGEQMSLSAQAAVRRELLKSLQQAQSSANVDGAPWAKGSLENAVADVLHGRTAMDLTDAREEGMIDVLGICLEPELYVRPLDEIYAEKGLQTPPLGWNDHHDFIHQAAVDAQAIIRSAFDKYPELSGKIAQMQYRGPKLPGVLYTSTRNKSYIDAIKSTMSFCLIRRIAADQVRYKYTSETSGSPYQTDILLQYDMGNDLRRDHRAAYDFIREFVRVLGAFGKDSASIRLEKFNKTLPEGYSGGLTAISLDLRANGNSRGRVSLHNLIRLIDYCETIAITQYKATPQELLERPRVEIKVPK